MEYVGQVAFICGTIEQRTRARTYLKWLLKQRAGSVYVDDLKERDDVTIVPVPREAIGYVTGNRGSSLRQVGKWGLGNFGTTGYPLAQGFDYYVGQDTRKSHSC